MSTALVVGGGIGGLSAALCLAQQGLTVTVLEQSAGFGEIGAGIQLSPNCTRVLHHLGLAEPLRAAGFLPEGTEMRHWRRGHLIASNPLGDTVRERYGFPYYHIHRADLIRVLAQAAAEHPRITLHTGARVTAIEEHANGVRVHAGNASHEGALLVGADGIHSVVRSHLFGEEAPRFTGHVAWRALVPAASLPAGLVRPMSTVWWGPGRHFVHYFVRGGELVNCVCVVEKQGWELESWTERGDHAEQFQSGSVVIGFDELRTSEKRGDQEHRGPESDRHRRARHDLRHQPGRTRHRTRCDELCRPVGPLPGKAVGGDHREQEDADVRGDP